MSVFSINIVHVNLNTADDLTSIEICRISIVISFVTWDERKVGFVVLCTTCSAININQQDSIGTVRSLLQSKDIFSAPKRDWGKVMFSQASVCPWGRESSRMQTGWLHSQDATQMYATPGVQPRWMQTHLDAHLDGCTLQDATQIDVSTSYPMPSWMHPSRMAAPPRMDAPLRMAAPPRMAAPTGWLHQRILLKTEMVNIRVY